METNNEMINKISSLEEAMVQVESEEITYCHIQESSEGGYYYRMLWRKSYPRW